MSDIPPRSDDEADGARMKAILVLCASVAFAMGAYLVTFTGFAPDLFPMPQVDPPVQPAGYAFAIWGVIFLWLILSSGYGLAARAEDAGWDATRWPLFASFVIGAGWNAVANQSPVMASILIWIMLGTALWALLRGPEGDKPWLAWPVGLYAGWLTAASSVSLGLLAGGYGVLGSVAAAWGSLLVAAVLSAAVVRATGNIAYAAAVVWALIGIVVKNIGGPVSVALLAGVVAVGLIALLARVRGRATS